MALSRNGMPSRDTGLSKPSVNDFCFGEGVRQDLAEWLDDHQSAFRHQADVVILSPRRGPTTPVYADGGR